MVAEDGSDMAAEQGRGNTRSCNEQEGVGAGQAQTKFYSNLEEK